MFQDDVFYTEADVADALRISRKKLETMRRNGDGPRFVKIGGCVRYEGTDLRKYVEDRKFNATSEYRAFGSTANRSAGDG